MIEANTIRVRRHLKCFRSNFLVINAEDTNLGNMYVVLALNNITFNPMQRNPEEFKGNEKRYETMNSPKVIKKICADNLLLTHIDHFLDELEDQLSLCHSNYSSEE